jgi:hypothetical protein
MLLFLAVGFVFWKVNDHFATSKYHALIDKFMMYAFVAAWFCAVGYKFWKFGKPEKINGKFEGFLEFKLDSIIIDKNEYKLDEIEKIEIQNNDYYGRVTGSRGFDSNISNGVNNYLTLFLKNKQKVNCMFELYNEFDMGKIDDILINYYSHGKLNFEQLLTIFKVNGKEELEDFKASLNATTTNSR